MALSKFAAFFVRLGRVGRTAENIMLMLVLGGMVAVAFMQIILREVFSTGVIWGNELVRILVLWLAMVGAVAAARDNRHIRIDLLSHLLPEKAVKAIRILVDLFAAVVSAVIAWYVWKYIQLQAELDFTVLNDVSAFAVRIIAPIGFVLLSYRFMVLVIIQTIELTTGLDLSEESG